MWSWSKFNWCSPGYRSDICYQLVNHKTGVYKKVSINTLVEEHFGHILYPQDKTLEGLRHVSLDKDYELY